MSNIDNVLPSRPPTLKELREIQQSVGMSDTGAMVAWVENDEVHGLIVTYHLCLDRLDEFLIRHGIKE